jgi:Secretion system C-terminal sorting domain
MKKILFLLGAAMPLFAQAQTAYPTPTERPATHTHWCGSEEFAGGAADLQAWANTYYTQAHAKGQTNLPVLTLPVALYLVSNTDGNGGILPSLALGIMSDVNDDYRQHDIRFYVDSLDRQIKNDLYNDPPANDNGYWSTMLSGRKMANRTNVYFHGGGAATGLCGVYHGSAVGSGTPGSPDIVNCFGGCLYRNNTTVTHELGHYLAMPHTFYGLENSGNLSSTCSSTATTGEKYDRSGLGSNCTSSGDRFCDTYPDYNSDRWSCGAGDPTLSTNGVPNTGNAWSCPVNSFSSSPAAYPRVRMQIYGNNYMSYADDACANTFTTNQRDRMRTFITSRRANLTSVVITGDSIAQKVVDVTPDNYLVSAISLTGTELVWNKVPNARAYIVQFIGNSIGTQILGEIIVYDTLCTIPAAYGPVGRNNIWWKVMPFNKRFFTPNFNTKQKVSLLISTANAMEGLTNAAVVPNPVTADDFKLVLDLDKAMDLTISVSDITGRIVRNLGLQKATEGENKFDISATDLPNGTYLVQMRNDAAVKTIKMIIAK